MPKNFEFSPKKFPPPQQGPKVAFWATSKGNVFLGPAFCAGQKNGHFPPLFRWVCPLTPCPAKKKMVWTTLSPDLILSPACALCVPGPLRWLLGPVTRHTARHILRRTEEVLDIRRLVVQYFTTNRQALVDLFQRVGGKGTTPLLQRGGSWWEAESLVPSHGGMASRTGGN